MWRLVLMTTLLACVVACSNQHERSVAAKGLLDGDYWPVSTLEPHSLHTVQITVVNNFECRVCAGLEPKMAALRAKYKGRISVDYYDVLSPETKTAAIAHYILKNDPHAHELRDYLYANLATMKSNGPATAVLIGQFGMDPAALDDPSVLREIERRNRIARRITDSTPTLIIQGQIAMHGDVGRVSHVLDQLLVKEQE